MINRQEREKAKWMVDGVMSEDADDAWGEVQGALCRDAIPQSSLALSFS